MWVVDRFEGDKAIIEYEGKTFDIPKKALPVKVQAGDVVKVIIDKEGTDKKQTEIDALKDELFK